LVVVVVLAAIAAVLLAAALPDSILAGDAEPYRERMVALFSGRVPYLDFPFEHLPGAVVPLALAWLLGGFIDLQRYVLALSFVSTGLLIATGLVLRRLEKHIGKGLTVRWLILVVPLLPFLLFRNDNWPVLLVVAAFALAVEGRKAAASWLISLGIISKFWPVAWAALEWWQGRRRWAIGLVALGVGSLALLRTDPVMAVQRPVGLHTETLAGSLFGFVRAVTGAPSGVVQTSAAYIDVPGWAVIINLAVGVWLAAIALSKMRLPFNWTRAWLLMGLWTGVMMVSSPLLSTQYVAWLGPFAATGKRPWILALLVNVVSLILIATWSDLFEGKVWWWALLLVRNFLLIWQIYLLSQMITTTS
jgi:hypothetical protein